MGTYKFLRERYIKGLISHYYMHPFKAGSCFLLCPEHWLVDRCPMSHLDVLDFDILLKILKHPLLRKLFTANIVAT